MNAPILMRSRGSRASERTWRLEVVLLTVVFGLLAVLGGEGRAWATTFNVKPVRLFLQQAGATTQIEIRSEADEPIALQLNAVRWSQSSDGKDVEEPTDEVVFFPRIFTLPPRARKVVRVGLTSPEAPSAERTWRLYMTQLPLDTQNTGTHVRVMLRIGVPIFLAPKESKVEGVVHRLELEGCRLRFDIVNQGTVHFRPTTITMYAFDETGTETFLQSQSGWYVLEGTSQRREFDLPQEVCGRVASLAVHLEGPELSLDGEVTLASRPAEPSAP